MGFDLLAGADGGDQRVRVGAGRYRRYQGSQRARQARANAAPTTSQRRVSRGVGPLCAYDALRIAWVSRQSQVPLAVCPLRQPSSTPFFTAADGKQAWSSATSRQVAKKMASACGKNPDDFNGKCWRIGRPRICAMCRAMPGGRW
eukprot:4684913-Pleurochrysis_carterae.AAC.1